MSYDPLVSPAVDPAMPRPATYWHSTCEPTQFTALKRDTEVDVLVIGGGYTGLSAALELAEQQVGRVAVIDSHSMGFGCAGRNAGFVLSGSGRLGPTALAKAYGKDKARLIQQEYDAAVSQLQAAISRYQIDCDLVEGPYYKLAHTAKQARQQGQTLAQLQREFGSSASVLSQQELQAKLPIRGFHGATVQPGLALNPLKLVDGLARAAQAAGVDLYAQTPATAVEPAIGGGHQVTTPGGTVHAQTVLIASNAYTSKHFHASVDNRQFPVQSSILVTEPLSEQEQQATGLSQPVTFMDTRMMKYYYRLMPDNRLLFGGRGEVTGAASAHGQARLAKAMTSSFPALANKPVSHFWSGWVSVSLDSLPRVWFDAQQRVGYGMGYCGAGVAFANFAGRRLAQQAIDPTSVPDLPLYNQPLPKFPLAGLRRLGLRALYAWARVAER